MKTATSLFLSVVLIVAPVLAVGKRSEGQPDTELDAKCKAQGGCFVVTEDGFKKAMVIAFERGQEVGAQVGYQYGLKACKGSI